LFTPVLSGAVAPVSPVELVAGCEVVLCAKLNERPSTVTASTPSILSITLSSKLASSVLIISDSIHGIVERTGKMTTEAAGISVAFCAAKTLSS
jgi:hypothetical protein